MFTGIVTAVGSIARTEARGGDLRLHIATGALDLASVAIGDSIAVNGVCLTAVAIDAHAFAADVSRETLALTTLGDLRAGSAVNLELALSLGARLGGHLVSGHVDGIGVLRARSADARSQRMCFEAPAPLARYIATKGSICIDGVSLTVNAVAGTEFEVNIVSHTLRTTTLGARAIDDRVNLEVDLIARYLERLLLRDDTSANKNSHPEASNRVDAISAEYLRAHGFLK